MEVYDQNPHEVPAYTQKPVSIGQWMITLLLMVIPIVNIVMLFVWAFGGSAPLSKANWAKAMLIYMLIGVVLSIMLWSAIVAFFAGALLTGGY